MPRTALTDIKARKAKPRGNPFKLADGGGLYLLVNANGSKLWRWKFTFGGKERLLALGDFPATSLQEARKLRDDARALLKRGVDPVHHRKAEKAKAEHAAGNTFRVVAQGYLAKRQAEGCAPETLRLHNHLLELSAPIAARPIADITPSEVLEMVKGVHLRAPTVADRLRTFVGSVCRYGVASGLSASDPTSALRNALPNIPGGHHAAIIEPRPFGAMLRAIDTYSGQLTRYCLQLLPHVATRGSELRCARWCEVDFDKAVWLIPGTRMKMRAAHAVPLSTQVMALLKELHALTGTGEFLFPSPLQKGKPLSYSATNGALAALGYRGEATLHGFRSSFSSMANSSGLWSADSVERQLAHRDKNTIRGIYHRDPLWPERQRLMQWWSDRIDEMRATMPA